MRTKISFETVNAGKIVEIDPIALRESQRRISEEMRKVVKDYKRRNYLSRQDAKLFVINA